MLNSYRKSKNAVFYYRDLEHHKALSIADNNLIDTLQITFLDENNNPLEIMRFGDVKLQFHIEKIY